MVTPRIVDTGCVIDADAEWRSFRSSDRHADSQSEVSAFRMVG